MISSLALFLQSLFSEGLARIEVGTMEPVPDAECEALLRQAYQVDGWHFPGEQPAFQTQAALAVAAWFYKAALCYTDRSITASTVLEMLRTPGVDAADPAVHYSADLVLRHLPELYRLAVDRTEEDPLLTSLWAEARRWPLSAVGLSQRSDAQQVSATTLEMLRGHPGLWRLFLDRVLTGGDAHLLGDRMVAQAARERLGLHAQVAPHLQPYWARLDATEQHSFSTNAA